MNSAFNSPHRLCVRNVDYKVKQEELVYLFSRIGPVKDLYYPRDPTRHSRGKGYAFLTMEDQKTADRVVRELDGHMMRDRALRIVPAVPRKPR